MHGERVTSLDCDWSRSGRYKANILVTPTTRGFSSYYMGIRCYGVTRRWDIHFLTLHRSTESKNEYGLATGIATDIED